MYIKEYLDKLKSIIDDWDYYYEILTNFRSIAQYSNYFIFEMENDREIHINYFREKIKLLKTFIENIYRIINYEI